jgi:hypothetical protein
MKVISAIVGLVLLTASFTLAYLSNNNAQQMIENKQAIVMKYVNDSASALEEENFKEAIKFAKLAIAADPKSKDGFKAYEEVMKVKYKPSEESTTQTPTAPEAQEEDEEEEDMGC